MKLTKSESGFTLVETLIAIAISSAASLIIFKMMEESNRGMRMVENREDVGQFHREIVARLSDRFTCTSTLTPGMEAKTPDYKIGKIVDGKGVELLKIPGTQGRIELSELKISKVDEAKRLIELQATYKHQVMKKEVTSVKKFHAEMTSTDGLFHGCIARGTMVMDPKEACDLVLGSDENGESYFNNGICHFARGACEQSGRIWNESMSRCEFSESDLENMRQEICKTLGFGYSQERSVCVPTQAHIDAINELGLRNKEKQKSESKASP